MRRAQERIGVELAIFLRFAGEAKQPVEGLLDVVQGEAKTVGDPGVHEEFGACVPRLAQSEDLQRHAVSKRDVLI